MVLVVLLHTHHHVSFRTCDLILFCLKTIFVALGFIKPRDSMPVTLTTALGRLDITDRFTTMAVCPECRTFTPAVIDPFEASKAKCKMCKQGLYPKRNSPGYPSSLFEGTARLVLRYKPKKAVPLLSAPFRAFSEALVDFLARAGIEEECEVWKTTPRKPGFYKEIMDGRVWKTLRGPDGKLFFSMDDQRELRIGVTIGLDWYIYFMSLCTWLGPGRLTIVF